MMEVAVMTAYNAMVVYHTALDKSLHDCAYADWVDVWLDAWRRAADAEGFSNKPLCITVVDADGESFPFTIKNSGLEE